MRVDIAQSQRSSTVILGILNVKIDLKQNEPFIEQRIVRFCANGLENSTFPYH